MAVEPNPPRHLVLALSAAAELPIVQSDHEEAKKSQPIKPRIEKNVERIEGKA
jgi:hypothetical protein